MKQGNPMCEGRVPVLFKAFGTGLRTREKVLVHCNGCLSCNLTVSRDSDRCRLLCFPKQERFCLARNTVKALTRHQVPLRRFLSVSKGDWISRTRVCNFRLAIHNCETGDVCRYTFRAMMGNDWYRSCIIPIVHRASRAADHCLCVSW